MQWARTARPSSMCPLMQYLIARLALELQRLVGRRQRGCLLIGFRSQLAAAGVGQRIGPADEQRKAPAPPVSTFNSSAR